MTTMTRLEESFTMDAGIERSCSVCGEEYVNIGHSLKPGVIMMRDCACVRETERVNGVTITTARAPTSEERMKWRFGYGKSGST